MRRQIASKWNRIDERRGSILTLTAFLLPVLFMIAALTINVAYLQLTRTEMMVATDAAARAGGRALSEFQDVDEAKRAAMLTAALNTVGGSPLRLSMDDSLAQIEFGTAETGDASRYRFTKANVNAIKDGESPANAVRITGQRTNQNGGAVKLPFPSFGLADEWSIESQAVAMQVDRDISLVLDRSGSMDWKTFNWPPGKSPWHPSIYNKAVQAGLLTKHGNSYYYAPGVSSDDYQSWVWSEHFELGPAPNSPWEDLRLAVESFLNVLNGTVQTEQVSLSSYASSASTDLPLQKDYQRVLDKLETLGPSGATAIGRGLEAGLPTLFEEGFGRPLAAKTIIVMTDGMHNSGTDPVTVAKQFVSQYNVTIHTITFSPGADQVRMKEVAGIGGGQHYHADTGSELVEVFQQIANNLPTIVTQ